MELPFTDRDKIKEQRPEIETNRLPKNLLGVLRLGLRRSEGGFNILVFSVDAEVLEAFLTIFQQVTGSSFHSGLVKSPFLLG